MTILPNPFMLSAGDLAFSSPAGTAAAPTDSAPSGTAATASVAVERCTDEMAGSAQPSPCAAEPAAPEPCGFYVSPPAFSDISDVGEIFYYARRLTGGDSRFDLYFNPAKFMADIEEPMPLFLRSR